jgi:SIR2-like domain
MKRTGLDIKSARGIVRREIANSTWAVCIGAGTSLPIFPSWSSLVARLLNSVTPSVDSEQLAQHLLREFSPDAVIQAARTLSAGDDDSFIQLLTDTLYENLRSSISNGDWAVISRILARQGKRGISGEDWRAFLTCFGDNLPKTTALQIANVLVPLLGTKRQPAAILSFNAETMLFALLNALTWARDTKLGTISPTHGQNRELLTPVTRGISPRSAARVAYIFCHGVVPVPSQRRIASFISTDKLVFSEASYLHLASNTFSWQSSSFLDVCTSKTVIFIGVSLADPNMRRWLSWIHENRMREIRATTSVGSIKGKHFWIRTRPAKVELLPWLEASVELLGVRIVWIDDWSEVGEALSAMLTA